MADYADLYNLEHPQPPESARQPTAPANAAPDKGKQNPKSDSKPVKQQAGKLAPSPAEELLDQPTGAAFDINAERDAKGTFEMTQTEYTALFNLKRPLGFKIGTRVSLHDIVRCAINLALEDYRTRGNQSFLVEHLSQKKAK